MEIHETFVYIVFVSVYKRKIGNIAFWYLVQFCIQVPYTKYQFTKELFFLL